MSDPGRTTSNPHKVQEWQDRVECDAEGHVFDNGLCLRCGVFSYAARDLGFRYTPADIYRAFGIDVESVYGVPIYPKPFTTSGDPS